jgi:hypothetical protein
MSLKEIVGTTASLVAEEVAICLTLSGKVQTVDSVIDLLQSRFGLTIPLENLSIKIMFLRRRLNLLGDLHATTDRRFEISEEADADSAEQSCPKR